MLTLAGQLRIQAHANRLANHRLHGAMAALSAAEFHAPRVGFFPSLAATLNHILVVDEYYIGALHGDAGLPRPTVASCRPRPWPSWRSASAPATSG